MKTTLMTKRNSSHVRGQTIVLGCVTLLVLATTMMASYSLGNAIHQKIALQSHTDAQAYSLAVVEARALNITSHYNRAIAAGLVAQMSIHGWMAIASADVSQLFAGRNTYLAIMAWEAIVMFGCIPWVVYTHCWCVFVAFVNMLSFEFAALDWQDKLDGIEGKFNDAVSDITKMVTATTIKQNATIGFAAAELTGLGGSVLTRLKENAPAANFSSLTMAANVPEFACSMEGAVTDLLCLGISPAYRAKASLDDRSTVIQQAANAARPNFDYDRKGSALLVHKNFLPYPATVPKDAQWNGGTWVNVPNISSGRGHIGDSDIGGQPSEGAQPAKNVAANADSGHVFIMPGTFYHAYVPFPMDYGAAVQSDSGGGAHHIDGSFSDPSTSHNKFEGDTRADPCYTAKNCFVNYRGQTNASKDFGQPTVYGSASQSLRVYDVNHTGTSVAYSGTNKRETSADPTWELESHKGGYSLDVGTPTKADVSFVPSGDGYAVSKAKVYFHQLGDWQVPPNTFDPFWRAKLHFFSRVELDAALIAAGDGASATLLAPVEGE